MKASETNLLKFLQGSKQFIIPIYQRKYSWTLEQCKQLWEDIIRAGSDDDIRAHFVGSIVYIEKGIYQVTAVPQLLVIDGQQRMTTLNLLLLALRDVIKETQGNYDISAKKITSYYLVNNEEEDELYYKLLLTKSDRETLLNLIDSKEIHEDASQRVLDNYHFFKNKITSDPQLPNLIYKGISKLLVVDISLDRDHDNPQLIFESLNSTGLDLSQADLIRNYVLMKLEPKEQENLYKKYWNPMEKSFGNLSDSTLFDRFMRDYLTVKTGKIPKINQVYVAFKEYIEKQKQTIEVILNDVYMYSKFFVKLAFQTENDAEVNNVLKDINVLRVDVSYPFLLEVYRDFEDGIISKTDFINVLKLVESYVFRRAICGVPTNSLNNTFAALSKEIDKGNYLESLEVAFVKKDSYRRFPTNEEFIKELSIKDVYNFRNRNYMLRKLENHGSKEIVNIEAYTIEHIMPQNKNLSHEWKDSLGDNWEELQKIYLHTLGNLTLTRYNSEMSDKPFDNKRDMEGGFKDSPLRLNQELRDLDSWDEEQIKKRSEKLIQKAILVWAYPEVTQDQINKYVDNSQDTGSQEYTLEQHQYLTGDTLELFNELRKRVLNLDSSVKEEIKKYYIAYKTTTNFVDVIPFASKLVLTINLLADEVVDIKGITRDVSEIGRRGNGEIQIYLSNTDQLEDAMEIVMQSFEKHNEEV